MFGNYVNIHDFKSIFKKLSDHANALPNPFKTREEKVRRHWDQYELEALNSPLEERFNRLISGDSTVSRYKYACEKYLGDRRVNAVSLGCGSGEHEIYWARQGNFTRLDGCDLSQKRIEAASKKAQDAGLSDILHFTCADILNLPFSAQTYDVVILESALHHFSPLPKVMEIIQRLLKPGGYIFMTDFVGPTKFQWLPKQLQIVNALIDLLPDRYLIEKNGQRIENIFRPSMLRMNMVDPSEAIESGAILPTLKEFFEQIELKNAGGAILFHLFPRLSHNFPESDSEAQLWLRLLIEIENLHMHDNSEIGWWYAFGVYRHTN